ncbi:MAG: hypothetical protein AAFU71_02320 [Cyanobacteria bacterium J06632_22]
MAFSRSANALHSSASMLPSRPPSEAACTPTLCWGAQTLSQRGAVQPFRLNGLVPAPYNAIGTHRGTGYRGNAIDDAIQALFPSLGIGDPAPADPDDLGAETTIASSASARRQHTDFSDLITPHPGWFGPSAPVCLDPFGAGPAGVEVPPSITVTRTDLRWLELDSALEHGWLEADGQVLQANGQLSVTRVAIAPVWYLPGIAQRLQVSEAQLRQALYESTDGLFPDLITRPDLTVFLPPLAATTVDILGSVRTMRRGQGPLALHIDSRHESATDATHTHAGWLQALEACIEMAQAGGVGVMISLPQDSRAAQHLTSQPTRLSAAAQWELRLVPDILQWLGIRRIDQFLSMSYECSDHLARAGVEIVQQIVMSADAEAPLTAVGYRPELAWAKLP